MLVDIYMICAVVGGAVVLVQLLFTVLSVGAGHALHMHHPTGLAHRAAGVMRGTIHRGIGAQRGGPRALQGPAHAAHATHAPGSAAGHLSFRDHWAIGYLLGIFNVQGMVAGVAVLGLVGLATSAAKLPGPVTLTLAVLAALIMMALVAAALRLMVSMDQDGTMQIEQAIGQIGTVYLTIPGHAQGQGKVTLTLQQRLMEFAAVTPHDAALPTGQKVIVIAVQKPGVMEVVSAEERLRELAPLTRDPVAP